MKDVIAVVLAAGRGTRMKSDIPKVMHELLGKPIICHILDSVRKAGIRNIVAVTGYGTPLLRDVLKGTKVVVQKKLLGSGDAAFSAKKALKGYSGDILIICGDTPLIRPDTIRGLVAKHRSSRASATVLTAYLNDPASYGRIVRDADGRISKIVEAPDGEAAYRKGLTEINVGTYCFKGKGLFSALGRIRPDSKKKEYFLTDAIGILHNDACLIESASAKDVGEIIGINTRKDLGDAMRVLKNMILEELMLEGVTIEDPSSTVIYPGVKIGRDSVIRSNTVIESDVEIGKNCEIGPFARIRSGTRLGDKVEVGNFVEIVRTKVSGSAKIKHHTYLGDATVGKSVNIGAGTITANYDGKKKNKTVIEDASFIGVGAVLIAPVRIGKGAVVGAGSVVPKRHDVPKGATVVGVPARILKRRGAK